MKIYATVGDAVKFVTHPKGGETHNGEKGNWKTIEGTRVISDVEITSPADFTEKTAAIRCLWLKPVIRFVNEV